MTLRKVIKRNAKASLSGSFGRAILILIIVCAVGALLSWLFNQVGSYFGLLPQEQDAAYWSGFFENPDALAGMENAAQAAGQDAGSWIYSAVTSLLELFIMAPLALGVAHWYLELTDGRRQSVGEIFWPFGCRAYGRSVWATVVVDIRTWLMSIVIFLLPVAAVAFGITYFDGSDASGALAALLVVVAVLAVIFCALLVMVYTMRFFLVKNLLCRKYSMTVRDALRASRRYTKGHRWELVGLVFSFLPWMLLCVFVLPILYVAPYMQMTFTMYARYLYEDGMNREGRLDTSDRDAIILDDISPEKLSFTGTGESFYYPPQAWKDAAPHPDPAAEEPDKDKFAKF